MEYCIKVTPDTFNLIDFRNQDNFSMSNYIGSVGKYRYYSITSKTLDNSTIERIGKVRGVEKIFLPLSEN